jgi:hypothetical protein
MNTPFFTRLKNYYVKVGEVLRGEADASKIFPNKTDNGLSRERVYAEFLRQHVPSKCNVRFGGYVFDENGSESKQLDVIVTTDTCPQFNFLNKDGSGKTFSCVEGSIACAASKAFLDKDQLFDSLKNLASIPATQPLTNRVLPQLRVKNYDDWPFKIIFATDGLAADTILNHLLGYYREHPDIPECRKVNIIHVAGKYMVVRANGSELLDGKAMKKGEYSIVAGIPDVQAIIWTLDAIQRRASAATYILFRYDFLINKLQDDTEDITS